MSDEAIPVGMRLDSSSSVHAEEVCGKYAPGETYDVGTDLPSGNSVHGNHSDGI